MRTNILSKYRAIVGAEILKFEVRQPNANPSLFVKHELWKFGRIVNWGKAANLTIVTTSFNGGMYLDTDFNLHDDEILNDQPLTICMEFKVIYQNGANSTRRILLIDQQLYDIEQVESDVYITSSHLSLNKKPSATSNFLGILTLSVSIVLILLLGMLFILSYFYCRKPAEFEFKLKKTKS